MPKSHASYSTYKMRPPRRLLPEERCSERNFRGDPCRFRAVVVIAGRPFCQQHGKG